MVIRSHGEKQKKMEIIAGHESFARNKSPFSND
jgi:hypothetical protein